MEWNEEWRPTAGRGMRKRVCSVKKGRGEQERRMTVNKREEKEKKRKKKRRRRQ